MIGNAQRGQILLTKLSASAQLKQIHLELNYVKQTNKGIKTVPQPFDPNFPYWSLFGSSRQIPGSSTKTKVHIFKHFPLFLPLSLSPSLVAMSFLSKTLLIVNVLSLMRSAAPNIAYARLTQQDV